MSLSYEDGMYLADLDAQINPGTPPSKGYRILCYCLLTCAAMALLARLYAMYWRAAPPVAPAAPLHLTEEGLVFPNMSGGPLSLDFVTIDEHRVLVFRDAHGIAVLHDGQLCPSVDD